MRTRRLGTGALAALVLALALAACGSDGGNQVATLGGAEARTTANDDSSSGDREQDPEKAFRDFAACMREHGVDMPDPQMNEDGKTVFAAPADVASSDGAEVRGPSEEFRAAQEECDEHIEGVVKDRGNAMNEEDREQFRERALAMAQCMRDRGFEFPDPQFGDRGMVQIGGPGIDPSDPGFEDAMEACSKKAGLPEGKQRIEGEAVAGTKAGGE